MFKKTNPLQTPSPVWVSQCRQGEGCSGWGRCDCRPPTRRPRRSCTAGRGSAGTAGQTAVAPESWLGPFWPLACGLLQTWSGRGWGSCAMCTTLFLLSTLAMLWRRRFANRVQPEPSDVDGAARGSSVDADPQSSGREKEPLK
ncbi:photoreceptor disk component PRCD isoform X2 [Macaca mulatta]